MRLATHTFSLSLMLVLGVIVLPACGNSSGAAGEEKAQAEKQEDTDEAAAEESTEESEWDAEEYRRQMEAAGVELTDEQLEAMREGMEMMQKMQQSGQIPTDFEMPTEMPTPPTAGKAATGSTATSSQPVKEAKQPAEQEFESEFCWALHKNQASKKVAAPIRKRFAGQYNEPSDTKQLKVWNVDTLCKEFLAAVPMWADVSPPIMTPTGDTNFEDSMGSSWNFHVGSDGKVNGVIYTGSDGSVMEMTRIGDPDKWE